MCKQKIGGDCVVNNNTYYHPACMKVTPWSTVKTVKMCVCVSSVAECCARSVRIICINFYGISTKNVAVCTVLYCFVAVPSVRGVAAGLLHVLPEPAHLRRLHQEQGLPLLRLQAGDRGDLLPAAGPDVLPGEIPFSWKNADL